ncbi:short-chain dehydrogenase, partial [Staphylococcus warneri]
MANYLILGGNGSLSTHFIKNYIDLDNNTVIIVDLSIPPVKNKNILYFKLDASNPQQYKELIYFLRNENIEIDNILFSLGINYENNFFSSTIDEFEKTLSTNFTSFFVSLKKLYSFLSPSTSVVVISSQNGIVGHENRIDYGPSKAALIHIIKNLTVDFSNAGLKGIRFNSISPGYIENVDNKKLFDTPKVKKMLKRNPYASSTSIDDVCQTIDFLFSSASIGFRGQNLSVDYG